MIHPPLTNFKGTKILEVIGGLVWTPEQGV